MMEDEKSTFTTMNFGKFRSMLNAIYVEHPEVEFMDVVFEDVSGIYHPIQDIEINRKLALAFLGLKEKEGGE